MFSLLVFAGFLLFGDQVMSLFGGSHEQGTLLLIILSVGLLFDAATGPSRIVMMMTGHERSYVRIFGAVIVTGKGREKLRRAVPFWRSSRRWGSHRGGSLSK